MLLDFLNIGSKLIDKLIPDPAAKAQAQLELLKLQQSGELAQMTADIEQQKVQLSAINAEATSTDKWTSRARPGLLWLMYCLIGFAIPFGIVWAFAPGAADRMANGFGKWLAAIPDQLYWLMATGYLGYSTVRTVDKFKPKGPQ